MKTSQVRLTSIVLNQWYSEAGTRRYVIPPISSTGGTRSPLCLDFSSNYNCV